ncbi:hypothetical protein PTD2_17345 [Pseudoalteromonas tunicata D2]|uniref:Uncharacterized protein n=1 Tax=Pseudoalteromonas tunicata D2 TaxID=87626 RepID=A4CB72_9GAMM|nr:hypothetical protein PTD2_17345 [Pseudoalteromonas tunicata D2]
MANLVRLETRKICVSTAIVGQPKDNERRLLPGCFEREAAAQLKSAPITL